MAVLGQCGKRVNEIPISVNKLGVVFHRYMGGTGRRIERA
jgi:hypothetical protein